MNVLSLNFLIFAVLQGAARHIEEAFSISLPMNLDNSLCKKDRKTFSLWFVIYVSKRHIQPKV